MLRPAILIGLCLTCALAGQKPYRNQSYALQIPKGWTLHEMTHGFPSVRAPGRDGFAANLYISLAYRQASETLAARFEREMKGLAKLFPKFKELSRGETTVGPGLASRYLRIHNEVGGRQLLQSFYLLVQGRQVFTLTCSRLAGEDKATDAQFAALLRSFKPLPEPAPGEDGRYTDAASGLSFAVPDGWRMRRMARTGQLGLFGPRQQGVQTNILLAFEVTRLPLPQYLEAMKRQLKRIAPKGKFSSAKQLSLPCKRPATQLGFQRQVQGRAFQQRICLIDLGRRKLTVSGTRHQDATSEMEKALAAVVKSLKFAPRRRPR